MTTQAFHLSVLFPLPCYLFTRGDIEIQSISVMLSDFLPHEAVNTIVLDT